MLRTNKIYFNDRIIYLTNDSNWKLGQIYNYTSKEKLKEIIRNFRKKSSARELAIYSDNYNLLFENFSNYFRIIDAGGGLVINGENKILMIYRRGKWDLPKGKVDRGEEVEDAALREVSEETGITSQSLDEKIMITYHTYLNKLKPVLKRSHWYFMNYNGNEKLKPQKVEQITDAMWLTKDEIKERCSNTYLNILDVLKEASVI